MSHTHWDPALIDRLFINAPAPPVCPFRTKKECDENWTQFQHGHLGVPCVKEFQPAKQTTRRKDGTVITQKGQPSSVATCTIVSHPEVGESFAGSLARQRAAAPPSYNERLAQLGKRTRR